MKKKFWILIILLIAAIFIGIISLKIVFKKSDLSVASKKADFEITAGELLLKFEENEEEANNLYLNKILLVEGLVDDIKVDSSVVSVYMKDIGQVSGVLCGFSKSEINLDDINTGDQLKIKGICTGYLMDVVMNKCSVVR